MCKPYRLGITVGRFQLFHRGHQEMIEKALSLCEKVCVLIGSSQESGTEKNPFSYEMREALLRRIYGEEICIFPLPDIGVGNNSRWGEYVLGRVEECVGQKPDLLVSGKEARRVDWFGGAQGLSVAELYIPKTIDISASRLRTLMIENRREEWQKYCDERLWDSFCEMRDIVLSAQDNHETASL